MPGNTPSYLRPGAIERIFGQLLAFLVRTGVFRGHFYVLEVRGRKSGKTISLPVDPLDLGGKRYLVCARGESNWVRNARTAGEVVLARARHRRRYAVRELPPACVRRFSRPISTARRRGPALLPRTEGIGGGVVRRVAATLPVFALHPLEPFS